MEFLRNKKNIVLVIIGIIVVALIVLIACLFLKGGTSKTKLEKSLKQMGGEFYENFYYEAIGTTQEEKMNTLSKYTEIGIKVDLDVLSRYEDEKFKEELEQFKNKKTGKECDKKNTRAVVYPVSPYGKKDYKIEVEFDCGFDEK